MEIKKEGEYVWKIEKHGCMKVASIIYASEKLMQAIKKDKTLEQARNVACLKGIQKAVYVMPDAHQGYGFPIGGVAVFDMQEGIISPGGVGYDINCGVRLVKTFMLRKEIEEKKREIVEKIYELVPVGVGGKSKLRLSKAELQEVLALGSEWALSHGFALKKDLEHTEEYGRMKQAMPNKVSETAYARGLPQLGTLGAGNHFLELQEIEQIYDENIAEKFGLRKGEVTVMIHCGSRGLGHQVASDYIIKFERRFGFKALPDRELINAPLQSEEGQSYFGAMCSAVNYAFCNRQIIMDEVRRAFKQVLGIEEERLELLYDVAHNVAKIESHKINGEKKKVCVHRKGATRSFGKARAEELPSCFSIGQPVIIPGSMGTASYVLIGTDKAEEISFSSTAHGAGRVASRHAALKQFRGEKVRQELEARGIAVKAKSWKGLAEEAPQVYKDVDEVVRVSHEVGLAKLVAKLKPIAVIKG